MQGNHTTNERAGHPYDRMCINSEFVELRKSGFIYNMDKIENYSAKH